MRGPKPSATTSASANSTRPASNASLWVSVIPAIGPPGPVPTRAPGSLATEPAVARVARSAKPPAHETAAITRAVIVGGLLLLTVSESVTPFAVHRPLGWIVPSRVARHVHERAPVVDRIVEPAYFGSLVRRHAQGGPGLPVRPIKLRRAAFADAVRAGRHVARDEH